MKMQNDIKRFTEEFVNAVNNYNDVEEFTIQLRRQFWIKDNAWIIESIPWRELQAAKLKIIKVDALDDQHGILFLSYEAYPDAIISFTLMKENDEWKVEWQSRDVYERITREWTCIRHNNIEIRFFDSFNTHDIESISKRIKGINDWLNENSLHSNENLILIFGFNFYEYQECHVNPVIEHGGFGGDSRGGLISIINNHVDFGKNDIKAVYCASIILHEMSHEYTIYNKSWKGTKNKPSLQRSLFMEGIAYYYQYKYLKEMLSKMPIQPEEHSIYFSGFKAALNHREKLIDLLDNQEFITFNRSIQGASNPSYALGASLYDYLIEKYGFEQSKNTLLEIDQLNQMEAKNRLALIIDKEEYFKRSEEYFNEFLDASTTMQ